ncbi:MAG: MFS transporter [Methanomassiliicoccales archaeon]|nr:MAG: MFS transporter [Methanomassiliicoccales archaeon]
MKRHDPNLKVPSKVKWLIILTSFVAIGHGFLITAVSAYLPEMGISSEQVGAILGASGLAMVICAIPFGILSDRIGRKKVLMVGLVTTPPVLLICSISHSAELFLVANILMGISEGAFLSAWNAMIADQTTVDNRDLAFSMSFIVYGGFTGLGFALPVSFPFIQDITGLSSVEVHSYAFLVLGLLSVISPITIWRLLRDYKERAPSVRVKRGLLKPNSKRALLRFSVNNMLIGLGAGLIIPLVPTWLFLEYGVPDTYSGPLLALSSITIGFAAIFSAGIAHKLGPVKAIVLTQASSTIFMFAIPFMPGATEAAAVYLVRAALMNMAGPIMDAYLMGIIDKDDRGIASAINSIIWRLPNSATTIIGGILLASGYYALPFILASTIYLIAITAFYINFKDVSPNRDIQVA